MNVCRELLIMFFALPLFYAFQLSAPNQSLEKQQTPESVTTAYFDALRNNRLNDLAAYMHPEALNRFRNMLMPVIEHGTKDKNVANKVLSIFDGVKSIEELKALSPQGFFTSLFKGISAINPEIRNIYANTKIQIIGHVNEGDTVHVVYRGSTLMNGASMIQLDVVSLKQQGSDWRLLLTGEMENLVNLLK